jgi:hypothetical protein
MSASTEWKGELYDRIFDEVLKGLGRVFEASGLEPIEGQLKHLYVSEGNDQIGRGERGDIELSATIAAYERFIAERKERSGMGGINGGHN